MLKKCKVGEKLMGNAFELTVLADDEEFGFSCLREAIAEIKRIENLLTTYKDDSITNLINNNAGIAPVLVPFEVYSLIERSLIISRLTDGAFDLSYGSIDKNLWNFNKNMTSLPQPELALSLVSLINYKNIILDKKSCSVFLKEKGMRIGFGGIGKGYAAEMAKKLLINKGIHCGLVNASGDISCWGLQVDGKPWKVGIVNPDNSSIPFSSLSLTNKAIATSGNYEKYVIIDGKKYSHTINPKTGMPIAGIKSTTIICSNAEIADAMTTPVMIMGIQSGLNLVNQINDLECIIIDDNNSIFTSKNINII